MNFFQSRTAVRVDRETGNAGSAITVSGYDVKVRGIYFFTCYLIVRFKYYKYTCSSY